jgi:hypothetical protein
MPVPWPPVPGYRRRSARRRAAAWSGLAAVLTSLLLGSFGHLPLPGPTAPPLPFALSICTVDGLRPLDGPAADTGPQAEEHGGLCLLCLPLGVSGAPAATLPVVVLAAIAVPRHLAAPVSRTRHHGPSQDFGTARDARGPPRRPA